MKLKEWVNWWNRNYKLSIADRMMYVDFSILQNVDGASEFNEFINGDFTLIHRVLIDPPGEKIIKNKTRIVKKS